MITNEEKEKIIQELQKRNISRCPMCGNNNFIIADGYFNSPLQDNFNNINIGGPSVPSIGIICNKCGFISSHALGVLGLLKNQKKTDEGEKNGK